VPHQAQRRGGNDGADTPHDGPAEGGLGQKSWASTALTNGGFSKRPSASHPWFTVGPCGLLVERAPPGPLPNMGYLRETGLHVNLRGLFRGAWRSSVVEPTRPWADERARNGLVHLRPRQLGV